MNEDEINRAIAEHLGWMRHPTCKKVWRTPEQCERNRELIGTVSGPWSMESSGPPNYCGDLNAMHEAEKDAFGSSKLWDAFLFNLLDAVGASGMNSLDGMTCLLRATARQRAEAFLRTVGKWRGKE